MSQSLVTGEPIVLKLGGKLLDEAHALNEVAATIARLASLYPLIIVHGGGAAVDRELAARGIDCPKIDGLRSTPGCAIQIVADVLAGTVNSQLTSALRTHGQSAVGLRLTDDAAVEVQSLGREELGHVGTVTSGDGKPWLDLMASGILPVISSIGTDRAGQVLNINADDAALGVAQAVGARTVIYLTEAAGVLDAHGVIIPELDGDAIAEAIATGVVHTGMVPKLKAALKAADHLGARVHIAATEDLEPMLAGAARGTAVVPGLIGSMRRPVACTRP